MRIYRRVLLDCPTECDHLLSIAEIDGLYQISPCSRIMWCCVEPEAIKETCCEKGAFHSLTDDMRRNEEALVHFQQRI